MESKIIKMKKTYINTKNRILITAVLLILFGVIIGCDMEELYSIWCDRQITVDGISEGSEWNRARHYVYISDDGGLTVGVLNDEKMLYLRLSTRNQALQREIMAAGLFVWLNETGNQKLTYGIHFPLPAKDVEPGPWKRSTVPGKNSINQIEPSSKPDLFTEISHGNIEIIRSKENESSVIVAGHTSQDGFQCRIGKTRDTFIYELQVPLIKNEKSPHGIAVNKPKIIGIGLVIGENEHSRQEIGDRGSGTGGGRGPSGPGGGPGDSGQPPQGQHDMGGMKNKEQSINFWFKVHLAERP